MTSINYIIRTANAHGTSQEPRLHRQPWPLWLEQALKFLSVGVLNTVLDTTLYFVLTRWLGFATLKILAKGISYGVGILNSFYWNRSWTFKAQTDALLAAFVSFTLAKLVGMSINAGVMYLCLSRLDLNELLALALATASSLVWNFSISKFLIFKK